MINFINENEVIFKLSDLLQLNASVKFAKFVRLPFISLSNLPVTKNNRCGALTWEEAERNGYTRIEYNFAEKRIKKQMSEYKKRGKLEISEFVIAYCEDDEQFYLIDGQGRICAIILLSRENESYKQWLKDDYAVKYVGKLTLKEIETLTRDYNVSWSQKWNKTEKAVSKFREDTESQNYKDYIIRLEFMSETNAGKTVADMVFGNGSETAMVDYALLRAHEYAKLIKAFTYDEKELNEASKIERKRLKVFSDGIRRGDFSYVICQGLYDFTKDVCAAKNLNFTEMLPIVNEKLISTLKTFSVNEFYNVTKLRKGDKKEFSLLTLALNRIIHPAFAHCNVSKHYLTSQWNRFYAVDHY